LQFDHHAFTRFKKQKQEDFISVYYPLKKKKVSVKGTAEQEEMVDALSPTGGGSGGETYGFFLFFVHFR
jgi:hypothetical protein